MKKKHKKVVYLSFERYLAQQMKNKAFRRAYEEESQRLRIAYRILQLRKKQKLSQKELARRLDTTQSAVARMETGQQNFTTDTLQKIASVFEKDLKIEFVK
ncbi:MAG: transcriptional regulator [Candidatus Nealsonbacteria bacterium CG23_combo_of_CG06-09_8_20_14_all_37_18]|uniref:Transcriptional regulator n=1 Tax=Candidatus Nealsonbacteria bacterium CG23_combo_of_CG06-09_8_20_14_all_37_18 TaxID=1974720 RepID=A0A2G9YZB9_9BACT|nr:MAG: transcriptional regulator [Candidatus Nealsonbacteria bacterium CG23_combo_of_CG06-09_8_20_14_all_37_18]